MTRYDWPRIRVNGGTTATALAAVLAACVNDGATTVHCSGRECPPNWLCAETGDGCYPQTCGDGIRDKWNGELCDDGDADDGDGCSGHCLVLDRCGNDILDPGESCDDGNIVAGDDCSTDCQIETCLNSIIDLNEECDEGAETATCDDDCTFPQCGDRNPNPFAGEDCDEGMSSATCDADCSIPECGDGLHNALNDEECDDGNASVNDACPSGEDNLCHLARCGDGFLHVGFEDCEPPLASDGSPVNSETCDRDCTFPDCGDGLINEFNEEECDDGNRLNIDACLDGLDGGCQRATCGDHVVYLGVEQCDDGNSVKTDACPSGEKELCQPARCGDGFVHSGVEQCDQRGDAEDCDSDCTPVVCGDGHLNSVLEQCETNIPCREAGRACNECHCSE